MQPLISIVIATYNAEEFLATAIQSVINQTYQNYELIVIDGGSKDKTPSIIEQYRSHITYTVSERDHGIYDAWNKGVKAAKGDWIAFVGADDSLQPDALEKYAEYISKNGSHWDIISSKGELIERNSEKVVGHIGLPWNWRVSRRWMIIAHPGSLHSRRLFNTYGYFNIDLKIVGDFEMLLRAKDKLKAGFMDLVTIRIREGGVSDGARAQPEHFKVVVNTGGLNRGVASLDFIHLTLRHFKRRLINK
jgi:glycosyltransferase involved in cell wall biosynthesis